MREATAASPGAAAARVRLIGAVPELMEAIGRSVAEHSDLSRPECHKRLTDAVGDVIFRYLDVLANACADGYAQAFGQSSQDREESLRRLLGAILADADRGDADGADADGADADGADRIPDTQLIASLAASSGWPLPSKVAAVAFDGGARCLPLPPEALADWTRAQPCALLPDPDGPGRAAAIDHALRGCRAAIGPAVPLGQAAASLRWARRALDLAARGLLADDQPIRCDRQLSALVLLGDEELARALCAVRLAPLQRLRPGQRDRIADTMLSWLLLGEKAAEVARHMHVHPQTVRYRLRQAYQLFGDQLGDPDSRFELQLALRAARGLRAAAGV